MTCSYPYSHDRRGDQTTWVRHAGHGELTRAISRGVGDRRSVARRSVLKGSASSVPMPYTYDPDCGLVHLSNQGDNEDVAF